MHTKRTDSHLRYSDMMLYPVVIQIFLVTLCSMIFDGGMLMTFVTVGSGAFWGSLAVLTLRNPDKPTKFDLAYVRIGLLVDTVLGGVLTVVVWTVIAKTPWLESLILNLYK